MHGQPVEKRAQPFSSLPLTAWGFCAPLPLLALLGPALPAFFPSSFPLHSAGTPLLHLHHFSRWCSLLLRKLEECRYGDGSAPRHVTVSTGNTSRTRGHTPGHWSPLGGGRIQLVSEKRGRKTLMLQDKVFKWGRFCFCFYLFFSGKTNVTADPGRVLVSIAAWPERQREWLKERWEGRKLLKPPAVSGLDLEASASRNFWGDLAHEGPRDSSADQPFRCTAGRGFYKSKFALECLHGRVFHKCCIRFRHHIWWPVLLPPLWVLWGVGRLVVAEATYWEGLCWMSYNMWDSPKEWRTSSLFLF